LPRCESGAVINISPGLATVLGTFDNDCGKPDCKNSKNYRGGRPGDGGGGEKNDSGGQAKTQGQAQQQGGGGGLVFRPYRRRGVFLPHEGVLDDFVFGWVTSSLTVTAGLFVGWLFQKLFG
jgi:hypothetical protein